MQNKVSSEYGRSSRSQDSNKERRPIVEKVFILHNSSKMGPVIFFPEGSNRDHYAIFPGLIELSCDPDSLFSIHIEGDAYMAYNQKFEITTPSRKNNCEEFMISFLVPESKATSNVESLVRVYMCLATCLLKKLKSEDFIQKSPKLMRILKLLEKISKAGSGGSKF